MKIDPAILQALVAYAAVMGGFYLVVTRPLLKRMDDIRADLLDFKNEVRADFAAIREELREIHAELKTHGERIARVEERLPPPMVHR